MNIAEIIKEVRATDTIDGLCQIANRALKSARRPLIAADEAREFGEHIFHIVADELPGGCEARAVVLACERRAGEFAA